MGIFFFVDLYFEISLDKEKSMISCSGLGVRSGDGLLPPLDYPHTGTKFPLQIQYFTIGQNMKTLYGGKEWRGKRRGHVIERIALLKSTFLYIISIEPHFP